MINKIIIFFILIFTITLTASKDLKFDDYNDLRYAAKAIQTTHYHDILKAFSGNFRQIFFFTPDDAKSEKGTGSSINKIVLDERYLEINSFLVFGADTAKRKIIIGYDGVKEKYDLIQYSNIETYSIRANGKFVAEEKSLVFEGSYPYKEINPDDFKIILRYDDDNEFTFQHYEISNGNEIKILEIKNFKLAD
ncbi:MAG: DUF1579 family protein [Candidatus Kapabacteria bacterium]|nr:DUF1579 family protein [Ignavibacteriota bacterium]MCW5884580.1 DUF1579 family protein [Candidatus Kapabacteria bacterium]